MKKVILLVLMFVATLTASAQTEQTLKFGYLSYDSVFKAMPEYATVEANQQMLREKYEAEQKRVEDDFNKKYEEFLDGQAGFPQTILQKRQSELQEMLDKNIAFKKESKKLLCQAHCEAMAPLKEKLIAVLAQIGEERGYAFILNTDVNGTPWLNKQMGDDITETVKDLLK
jgi:outer membrane protein